MATTTLKLDILTPLGPKRRGIDVSGVEIPGLFGELGVLPGHVPFVTAVVPGVVRFKDGDESVRIAVGSGFLEIGADGRVAVLVERALLPAEIDVAAAKAALTRVNAELARQHDSIDAVDHRKLTDEQGWLEAQIRAAS
jgi:F-type H+-transporting ATPase subunit epsilon